MARSRRWLRGEWRAGRFSTRGLPRGVRLVTWLAVAVGLASAGLIVSLGVGIALPGGVVDVPGRFVAESEPRALPHLLFVVLLGGLAVSAAALAWSAALPGASASRLTLGVVALVDAAIAGAAVASVGAIAVIETALGEPVRVSILAAVAGWVGLALAIGVGIVPMRLARRFAGAVAAAAALPPLIVAGTYLVLGGTSASLQLEAVIGSPDFPAVLTAQAGLAPSLRLIAQSAAFLLAPFVIWQAASWARASGGPVGQRVGDAVAERPWVLWLLVSVKLAWLLAGYVGFLPTALGGWSSEWGESLEDGPIGWGIAIALTGVAGWWLAHPHGRRISRIGFRMAALGVAIGFASWSLVMGGLGLLVQAADALPWPAAMPDLDRCGAEWATGGPAYATLCLQQALSGLLLISQVATVAIALAIGGSLLHRRRAVPIGFFLVAVGIWALPRALNAIRFLVAGDAPSGTDAIGSVELATLDTAITVMVAALAAGWWLGRGPRAEPWVLGLVLVVSTLMTRGSTLVLPGWSLALFYVALVFPLLYELALDSEDLNQPSADRPARVLQSVGLRAGALTLLFVGLGAGFASPEDGDALVAFTLFAPPFAAWLVAGVVSARARAAAPMATEAAERPRARHVALGTASGILVVLLLFGASAVAAPLVRGAATVPPDGAAASQEPTERSRALALYLRDRGAREEIAALAAPLVTATTVEELRAIGAAMADRARDERAWMLAHPATPCDRAAWDARLEEMLRLEELAGLLSGPIFDENAWALAAEAAITAWFDAQEATVVELAGMVEECEITAGS